MRTALSDVAPKWCLWWLQLQSWCLPMAWGVGCTTSWRRTTWVLGISTKRLGLWPKSGNWEVENLVLECQEGAVSSFGNQSHVLRNTMEGLGHSSIHWELGDVVGGVETPVGRGMPILPNPFLSFSLKKKFRKFWLYIKIYNIIFLTRGNIVIVLNDLWHIVTEFSKVSWFIQYIYYLFVYSFIYGTRSHYVMQIGLKLRSSAPGITIVSMAIMLCFSFHFIVFISNDRTSEGGLGIGCEFA